MRCEYRKVKLADLTTTGKGTYGIAASGVEKNDNLYTYLRITDINDDGTLNQSDMKSVADDDAAQYLLKPNDIVFARTGGSTGRNYFYDGKDGTFVYAGFLIKFSIDPLKVNPKYIKYYCQSDVYKNWVRSFNTGSTRGNINAQTFGNMEIPLPPREQQDYLVSVLEPLDEKIATNREINDNLEQQAASIFTEWLSTCADASTIGDMAHNILDYSPVASEQIRLLNSSDVTEGVFPVVPLVPNKDLKGHFKKRFQFGDILYSEIRPRNHHYGLVLFDTSDYIASTRLMVIRAIENKVSPAMLYQYLLLPEVEAEFTLKTESRSGTFPQGNYADMASIRVPYSPTDSQVAISETLTQIRYTIAQNQLESQRLAELRDTLLPKLMSGEIDVSAVQL